MTDRPYLDFTPNEDAEDVSRPQHKGQGFRRELAPGTVLFDSLSVVEAVARHFQLTVAKLRSPDKHRRVTEARGAGYWLLFHHTRMSGEEIAEAFGKLDHSTVVHGVSRCERRRESDSWFREQLGQLERELEAKAKGTVAA